LGRDGSVTQVRCQICSEVEGREKLLAPKLDGLWKHAGRRKALMNFGGVKKGDHFFLATNQHVRNERRYFARVGDSIAVQVAAGFVKERKRKLVQFRLLFWILSQGRPMFDYEACRDLFQQKQVPDCPKKHWSTVAGWDMADSMGAVLANHTKKIISQARYFAISADEVTTVDHESWLSVHIYLCIGFSRVSVLLGLFCLVQGNGASALKEAIITCISCHGGLSENVVAERMVSFGADGVSVFQGSRTGVTTQLKEHDAPFMIGVHCMVHRTNLAVEPLSNLPMVEKLETLCQGLYNYFTMSSKKHLEFQKLADIVETEGLRMCKNVKTRWISLLEPLRRVLSEYKTLVVKMCEDLVVKEPALTPKQQTSKEFARRNLDMLCDISTLLALPCLMPLLDCVNSLMKFAQSSDLFISDFVATVKICQADLFMMYVDPTTSFQKLHFQQFCDIVEDYSYTITQEWVTDLNDGCESLAFRIGEHKYSAHSLCSVTGKKLPVSRLDFDTVVTSVKAWLSRGRFQTDGRTKGRTDERTNGRTDDRTMAVGASVTWTHCSVLFEVTWG
jgi:hypothetical protein